MSTHNRLGYFGMRFDNSDCDKPRFRYAIFSSPRTGSNYLCARLDNLENRLGIPMEYLHADAIRMLGARLFPGVVGSVGLERYLDAVARVRTTGDGWFGTKIQPDQLLPLLNGEFSRVAGFLGSFDRLIFMTRDDKLGQAISGAIAYATGVWFNFGDEPRLAEDDVARLFPKITHLLAQYAAEEKLIRMLARHLAHRPTLHVGYEEILEDPQKAFLRVTAFLGLSDPASCGEKIAAHPTSKPPGVLAEKVRAAYLASIAGSRSDAPPIDSGSLPTRMPATSESNS